jgi:hypothetical protein
VVGYDPHFRPELPQGSFDAAQVIYVLNVIKQQKRFETLSILRGYLKPGAALLVAVRPAKEISRLRGAPQDDGIITSKGTFQKGFKPDELAALLEKTGLQVELAERRHGVVYAWAATPPVLRAA